MTLNSNGCQHGWSPTQTFIWSRSLWQMKTKMVLLNRVLFWGWWCKLNDNIIYCNLDSYIYQQAYVRYIWLSGAGHGINILGSKQNSRHFADDIFICIFLYENWIFNQISLKFVPKRAIDHTWYTNTGLDWRRIDAKPLSEPMMVFLLTHICATRPQCVKTRCVRICLTVLNYSNVFWKSIKGVNFSPVFKALDSSRINYIWLESSCAFS